MSEPNELSNPLVELIKGQERAAEAMKNQNTRLFGGEGQKGALPYILEQHEALVKKIDETRIELADKVESARTELAANVESTRKEMATNVESTRKELSAAQIARDTKVDVQFGDLTDKHDKLNSKVNWSIGVGTGIGSAASFVLGWLGIHRS